MKTLAEILKLTVGMENDAKKASIHSDGDAGTISEYEFSESDLKEKYTSDVMCACDSQETSYIRAFTNANDKRTQVYLSITKKEYCDAL